MLSRVLDVDPATATRRIFHSDGADSFTIETVQDVEDVVVDNKARFAAVDERARWGEGMARVASIPLVIYDELVRTGIAGDPKAFKRWLNDRDNLVFRTRPGRV